MASLILGYEYDIFISYRHKDNEYDGWVTEFVTNLKKELRATLKDEISIYFDENAQDVLLETHDVDKSLEGKITSLILIPIFSQTYCDTKSFAWHNEFLPFIKKAKEDWFGTKMPSQEVLKPSPCLLLSMFSSSLCLFCLTYFHAPN
ncbi:MAG TPA: hypothetical protein VK666_10680 [Chryseolinea sp.]|nr:hypothetical protein [Chryseolinea sp.]